MDGSMHWHAVIGDRMIHMLSDARTDYTGATPVPRTCLGYVIKIHNYRPFFYSRLGDVCNPLVLEGADGGFCTC